MSTVALDQTLQETMTELESALLAPVISGEMKDWVREVQQAGATIAVEWTGFLHSVIHVQYTQIANSDPELSACVDKMIQTDHELLEDLARFHEKLEELQRALSHLEWQEAKLAAQRKHVEEAGIALILSIKRQQAAASTWLVEAAYRDRGVGD